METTRLPVLRHHGVTETSGDPALRPDSALAFRKELTSFLSHRTSIALSAAATERLERLALLSEDPTADARMVAGVATECRFGFHQALREWKQNPEAQRGIVHAIEILIGIEIRRENADGAKALLSELDSPNEELTGRVEELSRTMAARAREAIDLRQRMEDGRLDVGSSGRRLFLVVLMVAGIVLSVTTLVRGAYSVDHAALSPLELVVANAAMAVVALVAIVLGRRRVKMAQVDERLVVVVLGCIALMLVHRIVGLVSGETASGILRGDLLLLAAATGAAGALLERTWLYASVVLVAAAILSLALPTFTEAVFSIANTAALGILTFVSGSKKDAKESPARGAPFP